MPETMLLRHLLLPELKLTSTWRKPWTKTIALEADKDSEGEVCPRSATLSSSVYEPLADYRRSRAELFASLLARAAGRLICRGCPEVVEDAFAEVDSRLGQRVAGWDRQRRVPLEHRGALMVRAPRRCSDQ